jgi:hypothetical protein
MCKELLAISVNRVVGEKRIIRKNGGPRRRKGTRGRRPQKNVMSQHIFSLTRDGCFTTTTFRNCLQNLLLDKESDFYQELVDIIG